MWLLLHALDTCFWHQGLITMTTRQTSVSVESTLLWDDVLIWKGNKTPKSLWCLSSKVWGSDTFANTFFAGLVPYYWLFIMKLKCTWMSLWHEPRSLTADHNFQLSITSATTRGVRVEGINNRVACLHSKCLIKDFGGHFVLQWRHNERDGVSNHQPPDCSLNFLFRRRSKKTSKLCVTGLCAGNSPVTGEFSAQRASNAENIFIWCHHNKMVTMHTVVPTSTTRFATEVGYRMAKI